MLRLIQPQLHHCVSITIHHGYTIGLTPSMRHVIFSLVYIPIILLGIISISILAACHVLLSYLTRFWTPES